MLHQFSVLALNVTMVVKYEAGSVCSEDIVKCLSRNNQQDATF